MRELISDLAAMKRSINALFMLAFLIVISIDFWLKNVPELFSGGSQIGDLLSRLAFAYISAYIFYFLVTHRTRMSDTRRIRGYLQMQTHRLCHHAQSTMRALLETSKGPSQSTISKADLHNILSKVHSGDKTIRTRLYKHIDIGALLRSHVEGSEDLIERMFMRAHLLDAEHVALLTALEECRFFSMVHFLNSDDGDDLGSMCDELIDYISLVHRLSLYSKDRLFDNTSVAVIEITDI